MDIKQFKEKYGTLGPELIIGHLLQQAQEVPAGLRTTVSAMVKELTEALEQL